MIDRERNLGVNFRDLEIWVRGFGFLLQGVLLVSGLLSGGNGLTVRLTAYFEKMLTEMYFMVFSV